MTKLLTFLTSLKLPNPKLHSKGFISKFFLQKEISDFYTAINYVHQLPYGRNSNRANYLLVLSENKGTCSTKHALLAALAAELDIPLQLGLGIFLLNKENTAQLKHILIQYSLQEIPEAHCFLQIESNAFDITFGNSENYSTPTLIQHTIIQPKDIGEFKIHWHKQFIQQWIDKNNLPLSLEEIWELRETCIRILSQEHKS